MLIMVIYPRLLLSTAKVRAPRRGGQVPVAETAPEPVLRRLSWQLTARVQVPQRAHDAHWN
jgi:hypothetical protein